MATRRSKSAPPAQYTVHIAYRDEAGAVQRLPMHLDDAGFYADVQRWRYVMANRLRITGATRDALAADLAAWLQQRCAMSDRQLFERHLRGMARASRIEVQIPFVSEETGYAARLFPWESALTLLTRPLREQSDSQSVLRWLQVEGAAARGTEAVSALLVRSAPGKLAGLYDLESELRLIAETLTPRLTKAPQQLRDPDREQFGRSVKTAVPDVLHLAGVDPYALQGQGLGKVDESLGDGFVLRGAGEGFDAVSPVNMARLACAARRAPLLLAVSSCFSAQRLCALAVAQGAQHAIGFVDTLTDADALLFFGSFYREWVSDWNLARAFDVARRSWSAQTTTPNAGVVLWSRVSLLEDLPSHALLKARRAAEEVQARPEDIRISKALKQDRGWAGQPTQRTSLNYSLLHNDRSPFKTFTVHKPLAGPLPPLQVEVALEVGSDACRCRFSEELPEAAADVPLAARIQLPLVASLLRQCTESLRTNLYIRVQCGERLVLESSERVTVLPADEWRDDGEDHCWLPSFVLPRDPAVLKVIAAAQRYLRTLLDDCTAGFDGYQRLDAQDRNAAEVVDAQVQAIWAALQHELPVNYINPPPSYTSQAQRLRSPSEVFRGQAATCIDLALLFASCLEFIGVYPVLFLVEGHAFPGYWRSDKAWWAMKHFRFDADALPAQAAEGQGGGQSEPWMFDARNLSELLRYVQSGQLVPFEATFAATQRGFFAALEEGATRLHPQSFDAMVDVQSARGANVTPLPMFDRFEG
ncbi:MAG: hypothetical protein J0L58_14945 [Burkholderiales bacterium]|nr:hypothetical protein [Burkholderiales bacterium]